MWEQKDAGEAEVGNSTRKVIASWCALCHQWRGLLWVTGGSWKEMEILQIKKFATGRADLPLGKLYEGY